MQRCFACQGPYHPATGHLFGPDVAYCGRCYRIFVRWMKGHVRRQWSGETFYDHAWTSIVPGRDYGIDIQPNDLLG